MSSARRWDFMPDIGPLPLPIGHWGGDARKYDEQEYFNHNQTLAQTATLTGIFNVLVALLEEQERTNVILREMAHR